MLSSEVESRSGLFTMISSCFWKFVRVLEGSLLPSYFSLNTICMAVRILSKNGIPGWSCFLLIWSIRSASLCSIEGWTCCRGWGDLTRLRLGVWHRDWFSDVRFLFVLLDDGISRYRSIFQWNLREKVSVPSAKNACFIHESTTNLKVVKRYSDN